MHVAIRGDDGSECLLDVSEAVVLFRNEHRNALADAIATVRQNNAQALAKRKADLQKELDLLAQET
jgi:hypothetical protein